MFSILVCLPSNLKGHIQFRACLLGIFLISGISCLGVDKTREPNTSGVDVVKATLRQIQDSHIFLNDNGFLRRLAYVESEDGTDPMTYRDGYHGGIWQIDESVFDMAKSKTSIELHRQIATKFKIVWVNMSWIDLRKPLCSALAASMYMTLTSDPIPPVYAVRRQATFWVTNFSTGQSRLKIEADFVAAAEALKSEECHTARLDVAFVVDGSGSIKEPHFNIAKEFVADIVENFDIGQDGVRVGFIQYSRASTVEIPMNYYQDKTTLQAAIQNIRWQEGATFTGRAINTMISSLFGDGNGARDLEDKVPRIGIVMTDGQSDRQDDVPSAADAAREQDITLYAIGIGTGIEQAELEQIANDPDEEYVFYVNDFSVIDNIRYEISQDACEEPSQPTVGEKLNSSVNAVSKVYFESDIPTSGKMTFTLTASKGKATAYLSTLIRNPNKAFHQWSVEASEENPLAQVYIDTNVITEDEGSRKKRQVAEDDGQLQLYGTIVNSYEESQPSSDEDMATGAPEPETVFSVLVEEGDTRIIVPTTERDTTAIPTTTTTPEVPSILTEEIAASGLSAGAISGVAIAVVVIILIIVVVLAFVLIKRKRAKEPDPNLINQRMSTVSTMSAERAQQEPYSEPYRIGSPSSSSAHAPDANYDNYQMGAQGSSSVDDVVMDYPVKPGQVQPEDKGSDRNIYTAKPHREPLQRSSIYTVETIGDKQDDSIYAINTIG